MKSNFEELKRKFGSNYVVRGNNEVGFDCPRCGPGTGKFHLGVNLQKQVFHCFKCKHSGRLGNRIYLPKKPKGLGVKFKITGKIKGYVPINPSFCDIDIENWRRSRGLSPVQVRKMKLGTSTDKHYVNRIVIPIIEDDEIVYFVARRIYDDLKMVNGSSISFGPKEISPPKNSGWLPRSEVLYGLDDVCEGVDQIVLVEGIFDAEHLKSLGLHSLALLGSNLSEVQIGKILRKRPGSIVLAFDGDDGGRKGCDLALQRLRKRFRGTICCLQLPEGKDPDDIRSIGQFARLMKDAST